MHKTVSESLLAAPLTAPGRMNAECEVGAFACGDPVLDDWIRRRSLRRDSRGARTFAVCSDRRVAGFFCLALGLVCAPEAESRPTRDGFDPLAARSEPVPVAILRRLAVDSPWQGRGLGADLLMDALHRIVATSADLGIRAILARAVEAPARDFYRAFGFARMEQDEEMLMLPLETAEAALRGV
ncbi:GNAT family N-acetyltransferase [Salinarimonas ramus]|uniref:N-acetyltransferase n=1 Tax=Salinarimonas ramus TaxID=690164 RepID=A0A917Q7E0_9HYPH|nr:GNAT family N-acetyltransferase [Salinarimonas ramus]GGK26923.1 N-acetyltransferase [Salinarimonas ramus]